ncbi:MAG: hypothetical protein ACLRT4_15860 [Thomasclavelia sp.]
MIVYYRMCQYSQLNNYIALVIQSAYFKHEFKIRITYVYKTVYENIYSFVGCFYYIQNFQIYFRKSW